MRERGREREHESFVIYIKRLAITVHVVPIRAARVGSAVLSRGWINVLAATLVVLNSLVMMVELLG